MAAPTQSLISQEGASNSLQAFTGVLHNIRCGSLFPQTFWPETLPHQNHASDVTVIVCRLVVVVVVVVVVSRAGIMPTCWFLGDMLDWAEGTF